MALLDAQQRLDPRHQRLLVDRLGQIFVGPGIKPFDYVARFGLGRHQNDRRERQRRVRLDPPADFDAVELRHHDVEQNEVRPMLARDRQRLLAVARMQHLIAVRLQPRRQNIAIGLVVVGDQDAGGVVHGAPPPRDSRLAERVKRH